VADKFNAAGAVARRAGIWLAFHNESYHQKPIDGKVPYDAFIDRLDPSVTRLQLDVGNMVIGGGDPMQYLQKYPDRFWLFHLKDTVADRSSDTRLGTGIFDFKRFLAAVPSLSSKPCYVEDETPSDELGAARSNFQYLQGWSSEMTLVRVALAQEREVDLSITYDAVVVGSGAAGGMAAHVLTSQGMKVLLLEAGKKIPIEQELRSMEWPTSIRAAAKMPRAATPSATTSTTSGNRPTPRRRRSSTCIRTWAVGRAPTT